MRQLRKVAVTQHSLPYQHLFSYHPERRTKKRIVAKKKRKKKKTGLRWLYTEVQLQITDRAHTDKPGWPWAVSNRKVTCILLNIFFLLFFSPPKSTEIKCFCVTEQLTHTNTRRTPKQENKKGERRFPFQNVQCWCFVGSVQPKLIISVDVMCQSIKLGVKLLKNMYPSWDKSFSMNQWWTAFINCVHIFFYCTGTFHRISTWTWP